MTDNLSDQPGAASGSTSGHGDLEKYVFLSSLCVVVNIVSTFASFRLLYSPPGSSSTQHSTRGHEFTMYYLSKPIRSSVHSSKSHTSGFNRPETFASVDVSGSEEWAIQSQLQPIFQPRRTQSFESHEMCSQRGAGYIIYISSIKRCTTHG